MDFVIVDSVGYYTPLGRNRDSSARFRSIRFTDLIAAEATRGNDTLLLLFLFIYRRKFREKQSFYSTIPFLQKKKSKINKLISREIRVQFIRIDRSQKRERKRIRMEETSSLGNFHANGSTRVFGAVILFFESKQAYPYPQIPLAMIDTGFLEHACVVQPHGERERERALLGWLGREVSEQWRLVRRVLQRCHPSHYFGINGGRFSLPSSGFTGSSGQSRERERKGQQWIKLEESKDEEGLEEVEGLSREATSDQVKSLDLRAWCPPRFPVSRVSPLLFHLSPILSSRR